MSASSTGRKSTLLSVVLIVVWANALTSSAADECELPDPTGSFVMNTSRFDEFRIALTAPDYGSANAVQRHFILSSIWSKALATEVAVRTQGACDLRVDPSVFPDLRAFLVGYRSTKGQDDFFGTTCVPLLQEVVQSWTPDQAAWEKAIADMTVSRNRIKAFPLSARNHQYAFTESLLRSGLARIYDEKSVMHALLSVDRGSYGTVATDSLVEWLRQQRSGRLGVTHLSLCPIPSPRPRLPLHKRRSTAFPPSATAREGAITIPHAEAAKDLPTALQHVVIIGDARPPVATALVTYSMSPYARAVDEKYCNRRHLLDLGDGATSVAIKCQFATLLQFDDWMLVFCENCANARAAEAFAKLVVNDPELRAVKRAESDMKSKGPYLVSFTANGR
jgi:hypothetical protein